MHGGQSSRNGHKNESKSNFGHFKGTGGLGLKMMIQLGYVPGAGLGTSGDGIVEPIDIAIRPGKVGISFNEKLLPSEDQSPAPKKSKDGSRHNLLKSEKPIEEKITDNDSLLTSLPSWANRKPLSSRKTQSTGRARVLNKLLEPIIQNEKSLLSTEAQKISIIDMRQSVPVECEAANLPLFVPASHATSIGRGFIVGQLSERLSVAADICRNKLIRLTQRMERSETRAIIATKVALNGIEEAKKIDKQCSRLEEMLKICRGGLTSLIDEESEKILQMIAKAQDEFPDLKLDHLACCLVSPHLRTMFSQWEPFESPFEGFDFLVRLRPIFDKKYQADSKNIILSCGQPIHELNGPPTLLDSVIWNIWLPKVRSAIINEWDPLDSKTLYSFLDLWYPSVLSSIMCNYMKNNLILPRLQGIVDSWDVKRDPNNHLALGPWLNSNFISQGAVHLFPMMVYKLGLRLEQWGLNLKGYEDMCIGIETLKPWRNAWPYDIYTNFIKKHIIPKLEGYLQSRIVINPAAQDLGPINETIHLWQDIVEPRLLGNILLNVFFPEWLDVLHQWLTSKEVDYDEIYKWQEIWRNYFPIKIMELEAITDRFQISSEMIYRGKTGQLLPSIKILLAAKHEENITTKSTNINSISHMVTFRDLVDKTISNVGLMIIPTHKTEEISGRPIYKAGKTQFYMDQSVLFVKSEEEYVWIPADMKRFEEIMRQDNSSDRRLIK